MTKPEDLVVYVCGCKNAVTASDWLVDDGAVNGCCYCNKMPTAINIDRLLRIEKAATAYTEATGEMLRPTFADLVESLEDK